MSLLGASQEVTEEGRQRAECPLETRIAKTVPLPLHSFFREDEQFQILRLQVKETCKHGSGTQRDLAKVFGFVIRTLFQQKLLPNQRREQAPALQESNTFYFPSPAARVSFAARDAEKAYMFFSPAFFAERQRSGFQRRQPLARFLVTSCRATRSNINAQRAALWRAYPATQLQKN